MAHAVRITYRISEEMLNLCPDIEFETFRVLLLQELSENWPRSEISVERCLDGEEGSLIEGMADPEEEEAAECIEDIIDDLMDSLQWDNEFDDH